MKTVIYSDNAPSVSDAGAKDLAEQLLVSDELRISNESVIRHIQILLAKGKIPAPLLFIDETDGGRHIFDERGSMNPEQGGWTRPNCLERELDLMMSYIEIIP